MINISFESPDAISIAIYLIKNSTALFKMFYLCSMYPYFNSTYLVDAPYSFSVTVHYIEFIVNLL